VSLPPLAADTVAVVVRGNFRPVDISPTWLRDHDLIGDPEYADSTFEVLIPNDVAFFTAGWVRCQATNDSLQLITEQQEETERLRDLLVNILRISTEKPISMLGINRSVHFKTNSVKQWNAIGDNVARNDIWQDVLTIPGMRSVTYWGTRTDKYAGRIHVQIEPSLHFPPGIFVAYNDHYELVTVEAQPTSRDDPLRERQEDLTVTVDKIAVALEVLSDEWEASLKRSATIIERVWEQGER
jgi:hypothetical protein